MKKVLGYLSFLILLNVSCTSEKKQKQDSVYSFKEYIFNTTKGVVSKKSNINIVLAKEIVGKKIGEELSGDVFEITPKIKGTLKLQGLKSIVFEPAEDLVPNTSYSVSVNLDKLFVDIPVDKKQFNFGFKTIKTNFTINTSDLQSYSKNIQYLKGIFKSSDVLKTSEVEKILLATQNDTKLKITWLGRDDEVGSNYYEFTIDSIQRYKNDSKIVLKWDGSSIGVNDNKGEAVVEIPGESNFSVVNVYVKQFPEQHLRINFSDPLKKQQNLKGLVSIQNIKSLKYVVDGNVLKVYPNKRVTGVVQVDVFTGIKNKNNYKLQKAFSEKMTFEQLKPEVKILTNGLILPDSKNLKFNFKSVNLKAVDVEVIKVYSNNILQFLQNGNLYNDRSYTIKTVGRRIVKETMPLIQSDLENDGKWRNYAVDISKLVETEPGAVYRVELSFKKGYSLYTCEGDSGVTDYSFGNQDEVEQLKEEERNNAKWDSFDNYYDDDYYDYNWRDRENPCTNSYFYRGGKVGGNILATNLGVIAKNGANNSYFFAVSDILTTNPIPEATIKVYNFQQQEVGETVTNNEGISIIDADSKAAFAIISKGKQKTYVKLNEGGALSLSKFNVSGKKIRRGLKGYVYGERGVWRPGDTIHSVFVLNDNVNPLPESHPIKMELTDPHGKLQYQKVSTTSVNGFYRFNIPTSSSDATGNWNAKVSVGGASFYKTFKVETVKPNRLKINIDFEDELLTTTKPINGTLEVKWLHGAIAKNLKTEVKMKLSSSSKGFDKFPGYVFKDPIKTFNSEEILMYEGKIDATGKALIDKKVSLQNSAPGLLNATFLSRVFENGGDFSTDVMSKKLAPYSSFVGIKSPVSKRYGNSYVTDENTTFGIATVDEKGNPISRKNLEVEVYKINWSWWWSSSRDNLAYYVNKRSNSLYKSFKINTDKRGVGIANVKIPDSRSGRYLIRIKDPISGHATGRTAYFFRDWWSNSEGNSESATMLVFNSDKESYNVGENAEITFPSGSEGHALVSIENSSEVLQTQWVKTVKGQSKVSIAITADMTPNVFVNISLLQPHASTLNDLPIRMYGVIPISVVDPQTKLQPQLKMPNELRPETSFEVKVSEKNGKKMTYTLSVVEEGLLDLTRFRTPDLWDQFYRREALGVRTWDVYDDVIGAYGGSLSQVFAIGGDEDRDAKKTKKANRFKPVVTVLGPFELQAGKTASHKIKLPNYVGSVRTMVVAGDNSIAAYGKSEKATPVVKPLMVLASLPRKLSPGEKVTLPVTVFSMKNHVKNVNVSLKLSDGITIIGKQKQQISFDKPDEKMVYFELDVKDAQGINTIEVLVEGNGEKASQKVEIDVVNPNPVSSRVIDLELKPNETLESNFRALGEKGTNFVEIEVSTIPPMNFTKRLSYLIQYPHGCVEQTTSSVFPQLFLEDIFDLPGSRKMEIKTNIENGIKRLGKFQTPNGGLSYWIGGNSSNDWGSSYAGHFMIEAQKKGYALPITFMSNWLRYQKESARSWRPSFTRRYSDVAQAYRLYTLALAGSPDLAAMNRLREFTSITNTAKWRLAAAYALAGQTEAATDLQSKATYQLSTYRDYYTYGSADRNKAMIMETLLLLNDPESKRVAKEIAKRLSSDSWMSTQTTAYSLLSMAKMVLKNGGKDMDVKYTINGKSENIETKNTIAQRVLTINETKENNFKIKNNKANVVYVRILNSGVLPVGSEVAEQRNFKVFVKYVDDKGNSVNFAKLSQGTDFMALVTISNPPKERMQDIALTQIFPSGWEIVNTRFTDFGDDSNNKADFTDIRDDRVNFYFSLKKNEIRTFKVLLNASYLGKYYLPGVQAEAMYDNEYFCRTKGQWIEVVK
jgi:uncharacterized protein YfaS (alpha-2-macroglobulin family)